MGADAFHAFYGIRFSIGSDDELDALEMRTDPRVKAARAAGLTSCFGRPTDGMPHFLLIGHRFGTFGVEGDVEAEIDKQELLEVLARTEAALARAGFKQEPKVLFQFDAQY